MFCKKIDFKRQNSHLHVWGTCILIMQSVLAYELFLGLSGEHGGIRFYQAPIRLASLLVRLLSLEPHAFHSLHSVSGEFFPPFPETLRIAGREKDRFRGALHMRIVLRVTLQIVPELPRDNGR